MESSFVLRQRKLLEASSLHIYRGFSSRTSWSHPVSETRGFQDFAP